MLETRIAAEATVVFIDIKGFTAGCAQMTVEQVRRSPDRYGTRRTAMNDEEQVDETGADD